MEVLLPSQPFVILFCFVFVTEGLFIPQCPLAVLQALGRRVCHNAEDHQDCEQCVDHSQQFVLQVSEIEFYAEHAADGLYEKQHRGDQGDPEHFVFDSYLPVDLRPHKLRIIRFRQA